MIAWLLGKGLALGKDILVSYFFGASAETDAYFIASNIPTLVYGGLLASVPVVLLPLYARKLTSGNEVASRFVSGVLNWYTLAAAGLAVLVYVGAAPLVSLIAPGASEVTSAIAVDLTRIFALTFVFTMLSSVLTTVQLAQRQSLGIQLIPIINHIVFIVGVALFAPRWGIYAAAICASVAWLVQVPVQASVVRKQYKYAFVWRVAQADRRALMIAIVPALIGLSIEQLNPVLSIYFASSLDVGTVSQLSYALRLLSLCTGAFVVLASTLAYPEFAHKAAADKLDQLSADVAWIMRLTLFAALFVAIVLALFSGPIVRLLLERGKLSSDQAGVIAHLLMILAVSIPFVALREVVVRGLYACGRAEYGMITAFAALVTTGILSFVLIDLYGISTVASAIVLGSIISAIVGLALLKRQLSKSLERRAILFGLKLAAIGCATLAVARVLAAQMAGLGDVGILLLGSAIVTVTYVLAAFALGVLRLDATRTMIVGDLRR